MALLDVAGVGVRFGGIQALGGVDLAVPGGGVTGLIGPNGAGKTTLFNVVCGLQRAHSGRVLLDGRDISSLPPHRRARLGIARTFQRLEIFSSLSVRENILVAAEIRRRFSRDGSNPRKVADEVIELTGLGPLSREQADTLPTGLARLVEVARALASKPSVLLLDEPSSGLDETETSDLGGLLGRLASDGMSVLLVEHDMDMVMALSRTIYVLDFGRVLAKGSPDEIRSDPAVRAAYLGAEDNPGTTEAASAIA